MESMESIDRTVFGKIFSGKKVLITGDTGFKGSWLSIWLNELGAKVFGYSLPPKTQRENYVKCNLQNVITHYEADVRDFKKLKSYIFEVKPDFAFHLAAQALVLDSYKNPHETFHTNLMGTVNFFEAVRNVPSVKVAINITSDKCYKNKERIKGYNENDELGGDDAYSASKACSEIISNSYLKSFFNNKQTCRIATVRAGNVIGGGDWAENRIIPDLFRAVLKNENLVIRNPLSVRPWQHVLEPLSGYLWLCAKLFNEGEDYCGNWNFGPAQHNNHTVTELIEKIIRKFGKGSFEIHENKEKLPETIMLNLDINKAVKYLKWKPVLNFEDTVTYTVKGYIDELINTEVYVHRVKQINEYIEKAKKQNISWAK